ncbi:hypothetical protein EXIGLDRAFT_276171 [Exidia glandulosa HHB12029]|uniref:Uncharacterized protein n=1 Tax=Exidia glandulosa HHB12029 TaxID=1314781 RepID=A0A166B8K2_EXIGL|nr:hypothetical protein EXIGLDRAFT_276171 [Exidia glandulosa HHB12029]
MATEAQSRKTRRSSRGPPTEPPARSFDADAHRDASRHGRTTRPTPSHARDALDAGKDPYGRVPSPNPRSRSDAQSHKVDSAARLRKDPLLAVHNSKQPSHMLAKPLPAHRALQTVAAVESQEHVSLSDGDVPPVQGLKFRKGQKSPSKDDKKNRRASNMEVRSTTPTSVAPREGLGLGLRIDQRREPSPRPLLERNLSSDASKRDHRRDSRSPDPSAMASRSRPVSPHQAPDRVDSDEEPFALDFAPNGRSANQTRQPLQRSLSRAGTPSSFRSNNSGQRDASPMVDSPRHWESPSSGDRFDFSAHESRKISRVERALADVANEAKSPNLRPEEPAKPPRRVPVPSENVEPQRPSTAQSSTPSRKIEFQRPSTTESVTSPHSFGVSDTPRAANSKSVQTKGLGLGYPASAPAEPKPSKLSQPATRPLRFNKSDPKSSPRDSLFGGSSTSQSSKPVNESPQLPQGSTRQRSQGASASPVPSTPIVPSPAAASSSPAVNDGSKSGTPTSRSLKGLRISSLAARFAPSRKGTMSPTSPASPEASPTVVSAPASSASRIPATRGRGPSGLSSPAVQQEAVSPARAPPNASPEILSPSMEPPSGRLNIAGRSTPEPPRKKNSQDQRMHALMDGLGLVIGGGAPQSQPLSRVEEGERDADTRMDEQKQPEAKRQSRTWSSERESGNDRREQREMRRQSSSSALRRTPESTPGTYTRTLHIH